MAKRRWVVYDDRKKIEELYSAGAPIDEIAGAIGMTITTVYNELHRGDTGTMDDNGRPGYSAKLAQEYAYTTHHKVTARR